MNLERFYNIKLIILIILENDGVVDPAMNGGVIDKVIGNSASIGVNYFSDRFNIGASVINILTQI